MSNDMRKKVMKYAIPLSDEIELLVKEYLKKHLNEKDYSYNLLLNILMSAILSSIANMILHITEDDKKANTRAKNFLTKIAEIMGGELMEFKRQ